MKFIVSKTFFDKVDDACFGIIIAKNIDNHKHYDFITTMLEESIQKLQEEFKDKIVKETTPITYYREAFRKIGINPNKFMCSIEALTTRAVKTGNLPRINSLVDLGNALSLKYLIPLGIHDLDKSGEQIMLRPATVNDKFIPFGEKDYEIPEEDEIVYVSDNDIKTRRWTWRQGENGKITEDTKNVFIPLDAFSINKEQMLELQQEFKKILEEKLNATVLLGFVDKDNREFEF